MCFKSKVKTPKTDPESLKAPEPVLLAEPKGVDFGAQADDQSTDTGTDGLKVKKTEVKDNGDGSSDATAVDTGVTTVKKVKPTGPVKRAMKKVTQ